MTPQEAAEFAAYATHQLYLFLGALWLAVALTCVLAARLLKWVLD